MPKLSKYKMADIKQLKVKAFTLYKTGLTLREVGQYVSRTYEWVRLAVAEMEKELNKKV